MRLYAAFIPFLFVLLFSGGLLETGFQAGKANPTAKHIYNVPAGPSAPAKKKDAVDYGSLNQ